MLSVSIVTPSYNQGRFIERTIRSVLDQGIPGLEHMVRDGGSTDETIAILARHEPRVRWVSERDGGQADAVNKAMVATTGEVVGWLNSDDIYYPGAIAAVQEFLEAHPEIDLVYGDADHIDEEDVVLEPYYTEDWSHERLTEVCFICQPTVFVRRRVFERYGLLDATLRYCMDYEYWLRVGRTASVARLPRKLAGSRMYAGNKTLGQRVAAHSEICDMLERTLGRVPTRWIYNHAFAVVDSRGHLRSRPQDYIWLLAWSTTRAFLRWRGSLPATYWKALGQWFRQVYLRPRTGAGLGLPT